MDLPETSCMSPRLAVSSSGDNSLVCKKALLIILFENSCSSLVSLLCSPENPKAVALNLHRLVWQPPCEVGLAEGRKHLLPGCNIVKLSNDRRCHSLKEDKFKPVDGDLNVGPTYSSLAQLTGKRVQVHTTMPDRMGKIWKGKCM